MRVHQNGIHSHRHYLSFIRLCVVFSTDNGYFNYLLNTTIVIYECYNRHIFSLPVFIQDVSACYCLFFVPSYAEIFSVLSVDSCAEYMIMHILSIDRSVWHILNVCYIVFSKPKLQFTCNIKHAFCINIYGYGSCCLIIRCCCIKCERSRSLQCVTDDCSPRLICT